MYASILEQFLGRHRGADYDQIWTESKLCPKLLVPLFGAVSDQLAMAGDRRKIAIPVEYWHSVTDGHGGDQAVDQPADSLALSPTPAIERSRTLVVHGLNVEQGGTGKQPPEIAKM